MHQCFNVNLCAMVFPFSFIILCALFHWCTNILMQHCINKPTYQCNPVCYDISLFPYYSVWSNNLLQHCISNFCIDTNISYNWRENWSECDRHTDRQRTHQTLCTSSASYTGNGFVWYRWLGLHQPFHH